MDILQIKQVANGQLLIYVPKKLGYKKGDYLKVEKVDD